MTLTQRQQEVLDDLESTPGWVWASEIGGSNGSDHVKILRQLVTLGRVDMRCGDRERARYRVHRREAPRDNAWRVDAACRGIPIDVHFSGGRLAKEWAQSICRGCPVRTRCAAEALRVGEEYGIWAGVEMHNASHGRKRRKALARLAELADA